MSYKLPYLLFDIGGTNTRIAVSFNASSIVRTVSFNTPSNYQEALDKFSTTAREILGDAELGTIAGGMASPLDSNKAVPINPPNLPEWAEKPLKNDFRSLFNVPVFLENDAVLAGLGEAKEGAGKNFNIVVYITISTGVNGVKIESGHIDVNVQGFEIGHQIIDFDNSAINGPSGKGELEDFISGREVKNRYNQEPSELNDSEAWKKIAEYLSIGLHNTVLYWSPEVIVLGGSMVKKISLEEVKASLNNYLTIFPKIPEIQKAQLGDTGGLYGALHYLKSL